MRTLISTNPDKAAFHMCMISQQNVRDVMVTMTHLILTAGPLLAACTLAALSAKPVSAADFAIPQPTETKRQSAVDVTTVVNRIKDYYHSIHALEVRYVQESRASDPLSRVRPYVSLSFAFKGENRLKEQSEANGHQSRFAVDSGIYQYHNAKLNSLTLDDRKPSLIDVDAYVCSLGIPITDEERATATESPYLFPYCFDNSEWRILPRLQEIDNYDCHVLESNRGSRIWVDSEMSVIRLREILNPVEEHEPSNWPVIERLYFTNFVKCADDVMLPLLLKEAMFHSPSAPENTQDNILRQCVLTVESIHVNEDVSDELFTLEVPDGARVQDIINKSDYILGNQVAGLDGIIAQEREKLASRMTGVRPVRVLLWVNMALIILVLYFMMRRYLAATKY